MLQSAARILAVLSGLLLALIAVMVTTSVTLRAVTGTPIPGDFEIVQLGTAVAVFGFLPYCQLRRGNFVVDFVLQSAPAKLRAVCDAAGGLLLGAIAALLLWRMVLGGLELRDIGEKSMVLEIHLWVAFPPILLSLALLAAVSIHGLWHDLRAAAE